MEANEKTSTSISMLSAGLTLLETLNTFSASPIGPTKDVFLSHPTMATKGGAYSPPRQSQQPSTGFKPVFEQALEDVQITCGEEAVFQATIKGDPKPDVTWSSNGAPLRIGEQYQYVADGNKHSLIISESNENLDHYLTCKAENIFGVETSTAKLAYRSTWSTLDSPMENYLVDCGRNTTSSRNQHSRKSSHFVMPYDTVSPSRHSGSASKPGDRYVHFSEECLLQEYPVGGSDSSDVCSETSSIASLKNVTVNREYDWTDEVRRLIKEEMDRRESLQMEEKKIKKVSNEETQTPTTITVCEEQTLPPKFLKPICDCYITEGETAHFVYIIEANQPTAITWRRNGISVERNTEFPNIGIIDDEEAGCLLISEAEQQHSGVYTCIAENIYGSVKCTAKLIIRPDPMKGSKLYHAPTDQYTGRTFRNQMSQTLELSKENKAGVPHQPARVTREMTCSNMSLALI